jgi:hypothetical protein
MTWEVVIVYREERKEGEICGGAVSFAFLSSSLHLSLGWQRVDVLVLDSHSSHDDTVAERD